MTGRFWADPVNQISSGDRSRKRQLYFELRPHEFFKN
jgi:hypothetical protein